MNHLLGIGIVPTILRLLLSTEYPSEEEEKEDYSNEFMVHVCCFDIYSTFILLFFDFKIEFFCSSYLWDYDV